MRLVRKIQLIAFLLLVVLIVTSSFISNQVLLRSFIRLEKEYAQRYVREARNVLTNRISELNAKSADWSNWDDTYKFVQDTNETYIKSNLTNTALIGLQIDIMLFLDSSGKVVYAKYFDLDKNQELPVPQSLLKQLSAAGPIFKQAFAGNIISGILLLPEGALTLSSRPILTSEAMGPAKGVLLFGRWLDAKEIKYISETVHLPVEIYRLTQKNLNKDQDIIIQPLNSKTIAGYGVIGDIYGKPELVIRIDLPRDILQLGKGTIHRYALLQITTYLLFILLLYWVISNFVLKSLLHIFMNIQDIRRRGDIAQRIEVKGKDEIAQLGREINHMLDKLKAAQDELSREKSHYQLLADNATDVIWTMDLLWRYTYLSPSFKRLTGFNSEEMIGHAAAEIITATSLKKARGIFLEEMALESRPDKDLSRTRSMEVELLRKDGSCFWTEVNMSFLRQHDNTAYAIFGITRDITERKKAEEANQRLAAIVNSSDDAIISKDLNGIINSWNPGAEKIYGYSFQEVKGNSIAILVPQGHADEVPGIINKIKSGEAVVHYETMRKRKDGKEIYVSLTVSPIKDTAGNIIGASSIAHDITERKKMEDTLKESEERYRVLFMSSRDAMMIIGPPSWNFISANQSTMFMFQAQSEADFTSCAPWEVSPERQPDGRLSAEKAKEMIETALRNGSHFFEWTHKRINGEPFSAEVLLTRIELGGQILVQATVRDITERKRAEEELKAAYLNLRNMQGELVQAKKMEAVATLAGGVAHEVRNPLAIIMQGVGYLEKQLGPKKEAAEAFQIIKNGVERADRIVQSMVDFSKVTGLELMPQGINSVIEGALELLKNKLDVAKLEIIREFNTDLPMVLVDKAKIEQALINIFTNSMQAMPDGGKLFIRTFKTKEKTVAIEIEDTGVGIPINDLPRIFDPFFTTRGPKEGAGLGLPITKTIIDLHDGEIKVESKEGKGTKVIIILRATN